MPSSRIASIAVLVAALAVANVCPAQSTYKAGDKIQVMHLGEWRDAVVVMTNQRGEVLAEYQFVNQPHRDVFKPADVRFQYEADAIGRGRFWSDAAQKFRVKAALLKIGEKEVTLRKQDMSEITVAIDILSDADKAFLKKLQTEGSAATGVLSPPLERFDKGAYSAASVGARNSRSALAPDPLPAYLKLKQGGLGLPPEATFDHVASLLPVGGPDGWLLVGLENTFSGQTDKAPPTRLLWVSLVRQKLEKRQLLPFGEVVIDYQASSHRLLTYRQPKTGPGEFSLWETVPTAKDVTPVIRWASEATGTRELDKPWARVIDASTVLQRTDRQEYVAWDVPTKRARYRITQESFFAPEPVLSGGRKYLFLPEDKGVRVIDTASGRFLSMLPQDGVSAVAPSDDGLQLAALNASTLTLWNLASASDAPQVLQAEAIGTGISATMKWVDRERLMVDAQRGQLLFSLKNKLTLWSYEFDANAHGADFFGRTRDIVDGHLVYAATYEAGRGTNGLAVGAVQLPGPKVNETETSLNVESLYVIKAGTGIKLQVEASENTARVQKALTAAIAAAGWKIDPNSPHALIAEMKLGNQQETKYRNFSTGQETTVSFTPHISTLKLMVGEQAAWQTGTRTGAPGIVSLQAGESVQSEVDKYQQPHPEFFDSVVLPKRILDPKYSHGVGTTLVTNRGLIPKAAASSASGSPTEPK